MRHMRRTVSRERFPWSCILISHSQVTGCCEDNKGRFETCVASLKARCRELMSPCNLTRDTTVKETGGVKDAVVVGCIVSVMRSPEGKSRRRERRGGRSREGCGGDNALVSATSCGLRFRVTKSVQRSNGNLITFLWTLRNRLCGGTVYEKSENIQAKRVRG